MSNNGEKGHDESSHIRLYMLVFGALMCLTVVTVWISHLGLPHSLGIPLGVAVALVKASLVAAIFMHLKWEKRLIYGLLGLTFFLAAGMAVVAVDIMGNESRILHTEVKALPLEGHAEEGHH